MHSFNACRGIYRKKSAWRGAFYGAWQPHSRQRRHYRASVGRFPSVQQPNASVCPFIYIRAHRICSPRKLPYFRRQRCLSRILHLLFAVNRHVVRGGRQLCTLLCSRNGGHASVCRQSHRRALTAEELTKCPSRCVSPSERIYFAFNDLRRLRSYQNFSRSDMGKLMPKLKHRSH